MLETKKKSKVENMNCGQKIYVRKI